MIRILLADDKASTRKGLALIFDLDPELHVAGEAENGTQVVMLAQALRPDVVVIDVGLRDGDGYTVTEQLHKLQPEIAVIVLATHADAETQARALKAGALACLEKRFPIEVLLATIKTAVFGTGHAC